MNWTTESQEPLLSSAKDLNMVLFEKGMDLTLITLRNHKKLNWVSSESIVQYKDIRLGITVDG